MPIANDISQKTIVIEELAKLVKVEVKLANEIQSLFNDIVIDYRDTLKKKTIDFKREYAERLTEKLTASYAESQGLALSFFQDDPFIRSILTDQELLMIKNETVRTSSAFAKKRATEVGAEILNTTKNNLDESYLFVDKFAREQGLALTEIERDSMVMGKFQSKLDSRVGTIATTETGTMYEEVKQVEATGVSERLVRQGYNMQKRWDASLDGHTRPAHAMAHGQRVPMKSLYTVMGESLQYPKDTGHGASAENTINCLHPDSIVQCADIKKLTRRFYQGTFITIEATSGNKITVTPNHPILTKRGWKAARFVNEFDEIVCTNIRIWKRFSNLNIKNINTPIEQIYNSCGIVPVIMRVGSINMNFHGDISNHDVNIIFANSFLRNCFNASLSKIIDKISFPFPDFTKGFFFAKSLLNKPFLRSRYFFTGFISFFSQLLTFFKSCLTHSYIHRFASVSRGNITLVQSVHNDTSTNIKYMGNSFDRKFLFKKLFDMPNLFFSSKVKKITHYNDSCFVYNLETNNNIYISNGIVNHNCRCSSQFVVIQ